MSMVLTIPNTEAFRVRFDGIPRSEEVLASVAAKHNTALLSFSTGKDAVALALMARPYFKKLIFYHYHLVPGLKFIEASLQYYEEFFGTKILRLPSPALHRLLANLAFQPPDEERLRFIESFAFKKFTHDDLAGWIKEDHGLPPDTPVLTGVRACDSLDRRTAIKRYGPVNAKRHMVAGIWDFKKSAVIKALTDSGVRITPDYRIFGRSFDGLDFRFLAPLKKHYPEDYERVREFFPMVEAELLRVEWARKRSLKRG